MPTLPEIRAQIRAIPHRYIFFTAKEIRALPKLMGEDETVRAITSGMMDNDTWLAVCTQRRLLFVNRGMIYGLRQVQLPLDRIQSIDHEQGLLFGSIRVWDGASYFTMRMVLRPSVLPFVKTVQEEMARVKKDAKTLTIGNLPPGMELPGAMGDVASQLERLEALMQRGVLTPEEFAEQKRKVLGV